MPIKQSARPAKSPATRPTSKPVAPSAKKPSRATGVRSARKSPGSGTRSTYRHGNLRQALIDEALLLIRESGAEALNVREAARRIGVSHNAYTRHFADRESLLAAVAQIGHTNLHQALLEAIRAVPQPESVKGKRPSPKLEAAAAADLALRKIQAAGNAYVQFALANPAHYAAMYDHAFPAGKYPALDEVAYGSFGIMQSLVEACQAQGLMTPGPSLMHTCLCWSYAHGVAHLMNSGRMRFDSGAETRGFLDFATGNALGHWPFPADASAGRPAAKPATRKSK